MMTVLLGFFLAPVIDANAQIRRIVGKVTDDKGQPIARARVLFQGMDVVRSIETKTDKRGEYSWILGIQGGTFRIIVHADGFEPVWREKVTPEVGESKEENFKLKPGEDYKTAWELSEKEKADLIKQGEEIEKKNKIAGAANNIIKNSMKLMEEKKYDDAIIELNKGIDQLSKTSSEKNDKALAALYAVVGECNLKLAGEGPEVNRDKLVEGRKSYESALKYQPNNPELMMNLGVILTKLGENDEAQKVFTKMTERSEGTNAKGHFAVAATMINQDQPPEAIIPVLRKCLALDPNYGECVYELGRILSGKPETTPEGLELLKKYVTIGKNKNNREIATEIIKALGAQ